MLPLSEGRVTFGALSDTFYLLDLPSGHARNFLRADQGTSARLLDALPSIDWIQCVGQAHDVPEGLQTQLAVLETVRHSSKPILAYPYDRQGVLDLVELSRIVSGSESPPNFSSMASARCWGRTAGRGRFSTLCAAWS